MILLWKYSPVASQDIKILMTEIAATGDNGRRKAGVRRAKKLNVKIDMTPMVDLGFLLIAFFIMTTELSKPSVVRLNMPKEGGPPIDLGKSNALTILLDDNDRIYYYNGDWKEAFATSRVFKTNFSVKNGLGKVIRDKQQQLDINNKKEKREGLMLLIKPGKGASYKNVIDALDETMINSVKKYAILKAEPEELDWLKKQEQ
jgi:biopolymer transport protein ExbD